MGMPSRVADGARADGGAGPPPGSDVPPARASSASPPPSRDRRLRLPLSGTYVAVAVLGLAGLRWGTVRRTEVHERRGVGTPATRIPPDERPDVDAVLAPQR